MSIFDYEDHEALGKVISVDTATVVVQVDDVESLRRLQVNRLAVLQSSLAGQHLIGVIQKITRTAIETKLEESEPDNMGVEEALPEVNMLRVSLIGTLIDVMGTQRDVFRRTLETVPEIDANCFSLEGERLTKFMQVISSVSGDGQRLSLGNYTLDQDAEAFLNGNKLFQRHAVVVGSTGSGKSWTTARMLEQVADLSNANAIVFDIHGEYRSLTSEGFKHLRVAGPGDIEEQRGLRDGVIHLPYWLLSYEALLSMFVDRTDQNAPNQAMVMSRAIVEAKKAYLESGNHKDVLANFTIDSPIPFKIEDVKNQLEELNDEMVKGSSGKPIKGDFNGKLSRLIQRFASKTEDRRLGFLFPSGEESLAFEWLDQLVGLLMGGRAAQKEDKGGVKVVDFSEVPSDILPLILGMVARLIFSIQQWQTFESRHPIALFCDEAHLYIPQDINSSATDNSVKIFERVAKEGRKYGVGLVVISQRPAELNRTVVSQCSNVVAMRLTNGEDQSVVKRLLPDSLGSFGDLLPVLDTGEALVVGDATLLPTRIRVAKPINEPVSATIPFWDCWSGSDAENDLPTAVSSWRKQSLKN
ncbi:ATP-binding protein [Marinobacter sp. NP-4(2019)]|uniref:ATP-binding protein n=1 Tax=Marinobacter sp. NP-4(2019) TaxID=2488665 RepID=UPI000FC3DDB9|nr:ATP-binding protein [Marinobacter sp. NP-4(2019)]AZT83938.1 ATP-binding protein [Marinobacter sp. NP-4(2019)]